MSHTGSLEKHFPLYVGVVFNCALTSLLSMGYLLHSYPWPVVSALILGLSHAAVFHSKGMSDIPGWHLVATRRLLHLCYDVCFFEGNNRGWVMSEVGSWWPLVVLSIRYHFHIRP